MKVDVRGEGLTPTQSHSLASTIRVTFREFAQRITSVIVMVSVYAEKRRAVRSMIEVHMADGHVEYVEERQRRVGSAVRRIVQRAWTAAVRWLRQQLPLQPASSLHQALSLKPIPVRSSNPGQGVDR